MYVVYFVMYDSVLILLLSCGHHDWFNKVFLFLSLIKSNCDRNAHVWCKEDFLISTDPKYHFLLFPYLLWLSHTILHHH